VITKEENAAKPSADVFSFGRLVYMVMTGQTPLDGLGRDDIVAAVCRGEILALEWPADMPLLREARELSDSCQAVPAESRPSITQVQASLHQWGREPGVSDDLVDVLRKTFPRPSNSGDLQEAIQKARAEHPPPRVRSPQHCATKTASPPTAGGVAPPQMKALSSPGAPSVQLLAPFFDETPVRSKLLSLSYAMSAWNCPVPSGICCTMHTLTAELQAMTDRLKAQACKQVSILDSWQCPKCKMMGDGECEMCGTTDSSVDESSKSERQRQALKTLPEVPDAEVNDQHADLGLQSRACHI